MTWSGALRKRLGVIAFAALLTSCESPVAPVACGPIAQVTVHAGETASIMACFNDPDGDVVGYALSVSNPSVATASLAGSVVSVDAVAPGNATITVTAMDAGGLYGSASFEVVVPNRPPRARGSIPAQRVEAGSEVVVDLASWFYDPDGESLAYGVVPSDAEVVEVALSGTRATLAGLARGVAGITATATDPGGLAAAQTFGFEVPNREPATVGMIDGQVMERGETRSIDLVPLFADPDGDPLTYSASSSDAGVVSAHVFGAMLELTGARKGVAEITVTAADAGGLAATLSVQVTVSEEEPLSGSFEIEIRFATAMSASHRAVFESAQARWMAILADTELPDMPVPEGVVEVQIDGRMYEESVSVIDDLMIIAAVAEIDGAGGTLARAGPSILHSELMLPFLGVMEFDAADLAWMEEIGLLDDTILHEMGHVLGIGSLWDHHALLRDPSLEVGREVDTHFAGAKAIRAFGWVGGASYTGGAKVPVANWGTRSGTDDSHWRKNVFGNELMTGSISPGSSPLSAVTVASLADLGYAVRMDLAEAYRLPAAAALLEHRRRAIPLGDDVIRIPIEVRDRNGRVVEVIPP